jgi:SWI/SNF-related matrix-associated actin-dependent regulator 1 of chromatin subfamily A
MAHTYSFGSVFKYFPTGDSAPFSAYFSAGKLTLGWALYLPDSVERAVANAWPFTTRHKGRLLVPFPLHIGEWHQMQRLFSEQGIEFTPLARQMAERALENALLRFDLSHAPKMGAPLQIEGLKTPAGFPTPLLPFQPVAVRYAQSLGYRALIGDDMGLGKTVIGLACPVAAGSKRVVVVTRSVALGGWARAVQKWTDYPCVTAVGKSIVKATRKDGTFKLAPGSTVLNYGFDDFPEGVVLLNYDILPAWIDKLLAFKPDFVVFDEVHALKEPSANRSQAGYRLMSEVDCVLGLSGTPISNRPKELFPILHYLHPGQWGDFFAYARRYCDAKKVVISERWVNTSEFKRNPDGSFQLNKKLEKIAIKALEVKKAWSFDGSSNSKELYRRLRSSMLVRRLKDDVLDLLPPIEETIPLQPSSRYWKVESGELALIDGLASGVAEEKKAAAASLHQLFAAAAEDKLDWAREWLSAFLEDTDHKIVIFFHYQRVGEALSEMLKSWEINFTNLWGSAPEKNGDERFQNDPSCRVALCSYGVAREAVTLTSAAYQMAMEYPWVPGWAEQARDRTRRIGQTRAVTYYYPVLVGSAEERIVQALMLKQSIISVITQGVHRGGLGIDMTAMECEI